MDSRPLTRAEYRSQAGVRARHTQRLSLAHRLLSLPWLTLVLAALVVAAGTDLLRPDRYAATATLEASTDRGAEVAAVSLSRTDLSDRVEQEVELDEQWAGRIRASVDHRAGEPVLLVTAVTPDPRLSALAADTAAALALTEDPEGLTLAAPAEVPTRAVGDRAWWWFAAGAAAVVLALAGESVAARRERRPADVRTPGTTPRTVG
ncbi:MULTISPECIES: hypothetical protein [unclassified Ornithinimicrobium]|uniref:hypothetical protein n=1 Tax=unclassified Ornithinimicrobium TaxID=2615080 RepID=UPI0038546A4D